MQAVPSTAVQGLGSAVGDGPHADDALLAVPDGRVAYWVHLAM